MKCINTIRLGYNQYTTCGGKLNVTTKTVIEDRDCSNHIVVDVRCENCGSDHHPNIADVEEIFNLDKLLTDYVEKK